MDLFAQALGLPEVFDFQKTLYAYLLDKMLASGEISGEEGKILLKTLEEHYPDFAGKPSELVFIRKLGVPLCLLISGTGQVSLDAGAKLVSRINISNVIEELKAKLADGGIK